MRNALTTMVGMAFLLMAACGSPKQTTGTGNTTGAGAGSTTGSTEAYPNGHPCGANSQCESDVCGITGTGNCCATMCPAGAPGASCAVPQGCSDAGACEYPPKGQDCGTTCTSNSQTENTCDGAGGCTAGIPAPCDPYSCGATVCNTTCGSDGGCAVGFWCSGISTGNPTCIQTLAKGLPCMADDQCSSASCGANDICCEHACGGNEDPACKATGCTAGTDAGAGACLYPPAGTICNTTAEKCVGSSLIAGTCDGAGTCDDGGLPCPNHFACNPENQCVNVCTPGSNIFCANGFYCTTTGACLPQITDGGCTENNACVSGICGTNCGENGCNLHCCATQCTDMNTTCGATDCDGTTELCNYADAGTACGSIAESCAAGVQQNPTICDGQGNCPTNPGTQACAPFTCNGDTACNTTCTDSSECIAGGFCDQLAGACCTGSLDSATVTVDGLLGKDAACCGFGAGAQACQTITYAMNLVNSDLATKATILASLGGASGNWAPAGETYPIVLGQGVELSAPGVAFYDPNSLLAAKPVISNEVFDIDSANADAGYASIFGTPANPVLIGMTTALNVQTADMSAIQVEANNTLYLAAATVNGNGVTETPAITVVAGGTLTLGQDQFVANSGPVTIGIVGKQKGPAIEGGSGIVCGSPGATQPCTVTDVAQPDGGSTLVIVGQQVVDIDAEDNASISLTAFPVIGVAPNIPGFKQCPSKIDASNAAASAAVLLRGLAAVTIETGTIQCISNDGFRLLASVAGSPTLTLENTTIQNTERAIFASAGAATVTGSNIEFNYNGVEQSFDQSGDVSSVNLGDAGNTVVCSSDKESVVMNQTTPGIDVLNTTANPLDAIGVAWDTSGPDLFDCPNGKFTNMGCSCAIALCTNGPGDDDMDAVYTSTGTVLTGANTQSPLAVANNCN